MSKYRLYDTFNRCVLSRHRSLEAAVKADIKLQRTIRRCDGQGSYLPTVIEELSGDDWIRVAVDDVYAVEHRLSLR